VFDFATACGPATVPGIPDLGIPDFTIAADRDCDQHPGVTAMPSQLAAAASFDAGLNQWYGETLGAEAVAQGHSAALLSPPPRTDDPFLTSATTMYQMRGVIHQRVQPVMTWPGVAGTTRVDNEVHLRPLSLTARSLAGIACPVPTTCQASTAFLEKQRSKFGFTGFVAAPGLDGTDYPDTALRPRYTAMFRNGDMDYPKAAYPIDAGLGGAAAHRIAREGIVLLRNAADLLPLTGEESSIALIGAREYAGQATLATPGDAPYTVAPQAGLEDAVVGLGAATTVAYADGTDIAAAVALARSADVAIVMAGNEQPDGAHLPVVRATDQNALVSAVLEANPDTVVVLKTAGPVTAPWLDRAQTLVAAWHPGQEDGSAVADVLYGHINPSGRLPVTFRRSDGSTAFPLGHGLSYTTFAYSDLAVSPTTTVTGGPMFRIDLTVTNTGAVSGAETPQVYVTFPPYTPVPGKHLAAWTKVLLDPGQSRRVSLWTSEALGHEFAYFEPENNPVDGRWVTPGGTYTLHVGPDSATTPLSGTASVSPDPSTSPGLRYYINDTWTPTTVASFSYGLANDQTLPGDWDGDGTDTLGVRRP
jgi:beta-glucosidase